jgi:ATP-binding cassette subfamily C protein CydD
MPDLRHAGAILTDVTVSYPGRRDPALDRVTLRIEPGARILLTGPSGAGKSTLLAVLLGFCEPVSGSVRAAHSEIRTLDLHRWRAQIAWVPQLPTVFAGTVRDNIALGRPGTRPDEVAAAAELAGADAFIAGLPRGYDTELGERGFRLSAGQRQRIALARAFLRAAPLLLLDEPTAHLDVASAAALRTRIATAMAASTVLVVSHDESWSAWADRRVELQQGRLAEPAAGASAREEKL